MRKLILTGLLILAALLGYNPTDVSASSGIVRREIPGDTLLADNPSWTGTTYSGAMIKASDAVGVSSNVNYITTITVQKGSSISVKLIGDSVMKKQSGAVVQISLRSNPLTPSNLAYEGALAVRSAWVRTFPVSYTGSTVTFEDSGIVASNHIVESIIPASPTRCDAAMNCTSGNIIVRLSMPLAYYESTFGPALVAWGKATQIKVYPITGTNLNGTLIQYTVAP